MLKYNIDSARQLAVVLAEKAIESGLFPTRNNGEELAAEITKFIRYVADDLSSDIPTKND